MPEYHPSAELAPRDIVARAILAEMMDVGSDRVYLDITHLPKERIASRFPQIYRHCLDQGLDITSQPIPVSPAAHYMMGGVRTNIWGETNLRHLYACGEAACTGVHGANRLASNSLLETVVFAKRVVERTLDPEPTGGVTDSRPDALPLPRRPAVKASPLDRVALQSLMWEHVGIRRSGESLRRACTTLAAWENTLHVPTDRPSHEVANLVLLGRLVAEAALMREESRGAHYRTDFAETCEEWRRHIVLRRDA
jgi:L-aspartate oxidase